MIGFSLLNLSFLFGVYGKKKIILSFITLLLMFTRFCIIQNGDLGMQLTSTSHLSPRFLILLFLLPLQCILLPSVLLGSYLPPSSSNSTSTALFVVLMLHQVLSLGIHNRHLHKVATYNLGSSFVFNLLFTLFL